MKKLVYILSIAIGLILTGCAKWENFESLEPDTWGDLAELTVEVPDSITSDVLPIKIATKNATNIALTVTAEPYDIDYTTLLQGGYNAFAAEVNPEGEELALNYPGVQPGNTYYLYVVAANVAGVQTTYNVGIGAYDVDAPVATSNPQLNATQGGKRATIAFNETILRDETMGEISFVAYDLNTNEQFANGVITDATANGSNLVVNLPSVVEFAEDGMYIVVLSWAEGAVTDLFGNKCAALEGVYNAEDMVVDNGYWWLVQAAPQIDGYFHEGTYSWLYQVTVDGENYQPIEYPAELVYVASDYNMNQIYEGFDVIATRWAIEGFLGVFQGSVESAFPAFTYNQEIEGETYECMTVYDPESEIGATCVGQMSFSDGSTYEVYLGESASDGNLYTNWEFIVMEGMGYYAGECPVLFILDNGKPGLLAMFQDMAIAADGEVMVGSAIFFDEPVMLNKKVMGAGDYKAISLKK